VTGARGQFGAFLKWVLVGTKKKKTIRELTVKDWIHLAIIVIVCTFVLPPLLRWLGADALQARVLTAVGPGGVVVASVAVLVWFTWHVRRERRSTR
jgi:hypothetical protein